MVVLLIKMTEKKRSKEATLGAYHAPACKKNFSFKLIPNYSITSEDAEKHPWQVLVNIKGVAMEEGYCPLSKGEAGLNPYI